MNRDALALALATGLTACATMPRVPEDPVEDARLQLVELVETDGDAVCGAEIVERDRLLGTRTEPRWATAPADIEYRWLERRADAMNLSQLSTQLGRSYDDDATARQAVHDGVPGARVEAARAMRAFDALSRSVATSSMGAAPQTRVSWAEASYATVWLSYFESESGQERDAVLDWLTTRSLQEPDLLEKYAEEFGRALGRACG